MFIDYYQTSKLFQFFFFFLIGNPGLCRQIPQSSSLRDVEWETQTCVLSFTTVGIWPEGADGTDVNACESSHSQSLLATGDDFGKVKLYSYPVCQPKVINYLIFQTFNLII